MRKAMMIALFAFLAPALFADGPANLEQAQKMATESGKPLLVDFYAEH